MNLQLLTTDTYTKVYRKLSKRQREILPNAATYKKLTESEKESLVNAYNEWRVQGQTRIDANSLTQEILQTTKLKGLTPEQKAKAARTFYRWEKLPSEEREALSVQGSTIRSRTRDKEWYELSHYTNDTEEFDLEKLDTDQMQRILDEADAGLMEVDASIYETIKDELASREKSERFTIIEQRMQTIDVINSVIDAWEDLNG